jgi:uncharacterized membrane protein YeaQ/YmgE (transglycosylase-associated protein family)
MSSIDPKAIIGVMVLVLLGVAALWGFLTYGPMSLVSLPVGGSPAAAEAWSAPAVLVIGLLAGWVSSRFLAGKGKPPGGIWSTLAAGVSGAYLGGILPSPWIWSWLNVNILGSIILSLMLAVGVERLGGHWCGKKGK